MMFGYFRAKLGERGFVDTVCTGVLDDSNCESTSACHLPKT